jgi:hypothetical protein
MTDEQRLQMVTDQLILVRDNLFRGMSKSIQKLQARSINEVLGLETFIGSATPPAAQPAPTQDIPDLIAGALGVSRGTAYDMMREALKEAAPVQEPVAWQVMVEDEAMKEFSIKDMAHDWCVQQKLSGSSYSYWIRPLYTTPPAAQQEYERGFIDGMQKQAQSSVDRAVNAMSQRQWVGLTDEEAFQICVDCGCLSEDWLTLLDAIEAKIKEKNT